MQGFKEWMALPPVAWMNAGLPARVDWAMLGSACLNLGGFFSFGHDNERWYLTVTCPWEFHLNGYKFLTNEAEAILPEDTLTSVLVGMQLLSVIAQNDDGHMPVFGFSEGYRLVVDTNDYGDPYGDLYNVGMRGSAYWYDPPWTQNDLMRSRRPQ